MKKTKTEQSPQSVMTHEEKVKNAISSGQEFIIVSDNDNKAYESGFADYLLRKYSCSNMSTGFRANLKNPVDRVPGGEFADPDNTTEKRPKQVGHTPGEWVAQNWLSHGENDDSYPEEIRASGWPHGKLVAKIAFNKKDSFGNPVIYQPGELKANARLIAASPKMYAALQNLIERDIVRPDDGDHFDEIMEILKDIEQ